MVFLDTQFARGLKGASHRKLLGACRNMADASG